MLTVRDTSQAVSYTHLDVYKRQTNISNTDYYSAKFNDLVKCAFSVEKGYPSCIALRNGRLILASTTAQPQTIWASRVDRYNAVSYTHLDVYKRQELALKRKAQVKLEGFKKKTEEIKRRGSCRKDDD